MEVSALPITITEYGATEHSTSGSLGNVSWVQKATSQLYRRNVPHFHAPPKHPGTSLHMTSFTRLSPHQVTNARAKRPRYEACEGSKDTEMLVVCVTIVSM